jgi:hypothetical protein
VIRDRRGGTPSQKMQAEGAAVVADIIDACSTPHLSRHERRHPQKETTMPNTTPEPQDPGPQVWLVIDDNTLEGGINDVLSAHASKELAETEKLRLKAEEPKTAWSAYDVIAVPIGSASARQAAASVDRGAPATVEQIVLSQLGETATAVPDIEHGLHTVQVDGLVDVGGIVALVLEHAAHVVDTHRHLGEFAATPAELATELRRQATEARQ